MPIPVDPARSLALLWRTQERTSRRGSELSVDRIVTAAIQLADAEGLAAVTMRSVAGVLGVGTMSIYTHVPGKPELEALMLNQVLGEGLDGAVAQLPWRAALEEVALRDWDRYHRHPWLLELATRRPPVGPNVIAKYEGDLRAMAGTGLGPAEMKAVLMTLISYVQGAARASVEAAQSGVSEQQWWAAHQPYLSTALDPKRFPTVDAVGLLEPGSGDSAADHRFAFEFGLARILDGIDAFVRGS
ncbi:TetR/AcrR family transcriptional regulator [Phytohabitans sp. LJ34]|uniref:TetR/AcrR family transcriptional regulator n=1 Tax=Phytohabitans sp. LJ34 TaxID=3452217 RepID=UPI003F8A8073